MSEPNVRRLDEVTCLSLTGRGDDLSFLAMRDEGSVFVHLVCLGSLAEMLSPTRLWERFRQSLYPSIPFRPDSSLQLQLLMPVHRDAFLCAELKYCAD